MSAKETFHALVIAGGLSVATITGADTLMAERQVLPDAIEQGLPPKEVPTVSLELRVGIMVLGLATAATSATYLAIDYERERSERLCSPPTQQAIG